MNFLLPVLTFGDALPVNPSIDPFSTSVWTILPAKSMSLRVGDEDLGHFYSLTGIMNNTPIIFQFNQRNKQLGTRKSDI